MVKQVQVTEEELIREDERLERLFRQTITKRKHLKINQSQFQSRVLDLLDSIFRSGVSNKANMALVLKRAPNILNKFCISSQGAGINGQKIIQTLHQIVTAHAADLSRHSEAVDNIVKTIFNIFVYKKPKDYVQDLLRIILALLKSQNHKIEKIVEQNMGILISFLDKGKDIDKVFFTFRKVLSHSFFCLYSRFEELLLILENTKNNFFVEQFLKFLFEAFHSKLLTANEGGESKDKQPAKGGQNSHGQPPKPKSPLGDSKVTLANFSAAFEAHCMQIYTGITQRRNKASGEDAKKTEKSLLYLEKLIEYLKAHTHGRPIGNMSKVLGLLKIERKAKE